MPNRDIVFAIALTLIGFIQLEMPRPFAAICSVSILAAVICWLDLKTVRHPPTHCLISALVGIFILTSGCIIQRYFA